MQAMKAAELIDKYAVCPFCGCDKIGNGKGTLDIDTKFIRTCACGFRVESDENGRVLLIIKGNAS